MIHNSKPIVNGPKLHCKKPTTDDVERMWKIARDAYNLLTKEGTGKDEQIDSKEFENNSYKFKNVWCPLLIKSKWLASTAQDQFSVECQKLFRL